MKKVKLFALSLVTMTMFGCATHKSETEDIRKAWVVGNTTQAQKLVDEIVPDKLDSGDEVIWLLEQGSITRANKDIANSTKSLDKAYNKIKKYEEDAKFKLGEETAAFLLNQSYISYKGYNYDKIMLSIYQSLNFIEAKDFERAKVELRRLQDFQTEAKRVNLKRIEDSAQAIEEGKKKNKNANYNLTPLLQQASTKNTLSKYYGDRYMADPKKSIQEAANIYANPFGYWLYGVSLMATGDKDDQKMAADSFRICAEMLGGKSSVLNSDSEEGKAVQDGVQENFGNVTYVVFETGVAPLRKQFRLDLPLWLIKKDLPHVAVNFPYLEKQANFKESVKVVAAGAPLTFDLVSNMDDIIEEEFYIELPMVITKTMLSAAAKATAQYFAAQSAGKYGMIVNTVGAISQTLTNDADLRTWTTLPKQIKIAKVKTPADGKITIDNVPYSVKTSGINIVHVKSMSKDGANLVKIIDFKCK
ncbi:hypothetical protein [Intestinicryptomonas porci]|uniref:Lipoprotein n=1 Tax=Intestinicryptomonas porci TaxID=2926320 RepID=A0ABU4WH09_9BACT|nr:hypothetical protein [Opitutales bacterium CLA-KB-P66]